MFETTDISLARRLDSQDPLLRFRNEFNYPKTYKNQPCIYLCGNSLGLLPKKADRYVKAELDKWARKGVEGHFQEERPWVTIDERACELFVDVVGAQNADEIVLMNTLSTNIHLLFVSFYRPTKTRYKILIEGTAFCSDHHIVRSQLAFHGYSPEEGLIELNMRPGESFLRPEDILNAIKAHGDEIALVFLGGVQYLTGQFFDLKKITEVGHKYGCVVGFDLAHAAGNVPMKLHEWNVDFAAWCTYKYLNSGPGSISGCFVHNKHDCRKLKRFAGWWGQDPKVRFKMNSTHESYRGAKAFQLSNPAVLPTVCVQANLEVLEEAGGMRATRAKSLKLTGYLEYLLSRAPNAKGNFYLMTPKDPEMRGCQLSLRIREGGVGPVIHYLEECGVIVDERKPDIIRVSPAPLYNSFEDVWKFVNFFDDFFSPNGKHFTSKL